MGKNGGSSWAINKPLRKLNTVRRQVKVNKRNQAVAKGFVPACNQYTSGMSGKRKRKLDKKVRREARWAAEDSANATEGMADAADSAMSDAAAAVVANLAKASTRSVGKGRASRLSSVANTATMNGPSRHAASGGSRSRAFKLKPKNMGKKAK